MAADDPKLLESFALGPNTWPPDPNEAWAIVKFSAEYAVDEQKPHGKDDADVKNTGRKARKFTAELHWNSRVDAEWRAFIKQVSPVGVNQGKAWETNHPDAELYNVDNTEILTMGEIDRKTNERTMTIGGISWIKKPAAKGGTGTSSAKKPEQWVDKKPQGDHVIAITSEGNTIDMGPGPVTQITSEGNTIGFNGADTPAPTVP